MTLVGTGFQSGATSVNFVEESGGLPVGSNLPLAPGDPIGILPATVTASTSSSVTAVAPAVVTGSSYFITVTTPNGTSAYNPVFSYTPVSPSVTSISTLSGGSGAGGSTAGGTAVAISGTGFVTGATVNFTEESGGSAIYPNVVYAGTNVTVNSDTSITAVSPAITVGTTYFVTVTTPTGTSANGRVFTYSPLVPTIAAISVSSGPALGGTSMTITGTGFVSGASVNFVNESNGSSVPAASVAVTGATTINVVTPALSAGTYFVEVTTPTGTSSNNLNFTAS